MKRAKKTTTKSKSKKKEFVKAAEMMKMPPPSVVRSIASDMGATRKSKGKLSEELAEIIAKGKKEKGIHPGSLKRVEAWVAKAKKTDRGLAAVATELAHLDFYRDVLGLDEMIKKQGQMFTRAEAGEKVDNEVDGPDGKKQLTFGGKLADADKPEAKLAPDAATAGSA